MGLSVMYITEVSLGLWLCLGLGTELSLLQSDARASSDWSSWSDLSSLCSQSSLITTRFLGTDEGDSKVVRGISVIMNVIKVNK